MCCSPTGLKETRLLFWVNPVYLVSQATACWDGSYGQNIAAKTGGPLHSIYDQRARTSLSPAGSWPVYGVAVPQRRTRGPDSLPRAGAHYRSRGSGDRCGGPGPREGGRGRLAGRQFQPAPASVPSDLDGQDPDGCDVEP